MGCLKLTYCKIEPTLKVVHKNLKISSKSCAGSYRYGFQGQESDDEMKGEGNSYTTEFRQYDPRLGRWLSLDPLAGKYPEESPYCSFGNNPIYFIDTDGRFKLPAYTDHQLKELGLTRQELVRFETIINNMIKVVESNNNLVDVLANSTGLKKDQIIKDFTKNDGVSVTIGAVKNDAAFGDKNGIVFSPTMVKNLAAIDSKNKDALAQGVFGIVVTTIHEYTHNGDCRTNGGKYSGEFGWEEKNGQTVVTYHANNPEMQPEDHIVVGTQDWHTSFSGHRGQDAEIFGLGVSTYSDDDGKVMQGTIVLPNRKIKGMDTPSVPSIPENLQGTKILETLKVEK